MLENTFVKNHKIKLKKIDCKVFVKKIQKSQLLLG